MGILLYDKNADFSASALGHAGLYTSVTDGLQGLFELRGSASKARQNNAPGQDTTATVGPGAVINPTGIDLTADAQLVFPNKLSNGGENTIAAIMKVKNTSVSTNRAIGSLPTSFEINGYMLLTHYNRRFEVGTAAYTSQDGGGTAVALDVGTTLAEAFDGTHQLVVATVKSEDSVKLYHPATSTVATTPMASGRFAYFNAYAANNNIKALVANTSPQSVSLFAHWDRVLTPAEVSTFYSEMKKQFGLIGLEI